MKLRCQCCGFEQEFAAGAAPDSDGLRYPDWCGPKRRGNLADQMTPNEIAEFLARLRTYGRSIEGDGFGKVGDLKAAVKRTCVRLEEVAQLIEAMPPPELAETNEGSNPDCCGKLEHNVPGCQCRKIWEGLVS